MGVKAGVSFQYISCCSLSISHIFMRKLEYCFNTSHVVVYRCDILSKNGVFCFNTSHVVVYPGLLPGNGLELKRFNTSHVVVYHNTDTTFIEQAKFQYISCCSLSIMVCNINDEGA